jgi:putative PEP-CTERM system histidine kinase
MDLIYYSYLGAATGLGFLAVLLLFSRGSSIQGRLFTGTIIISAIWAGLTALVAKHGAYPGGIYPAFEILRYLAWYVFLLKLLEPAAVRNDGYRLFLRRALPLSVGFGVLLLFVELIPAYLSTLLSVGDLMKIRMTGHVFMAIIGLVIIEQLFRNTSVPHRRAVNYLFAGVGGIFAFDFYMYADALLFGGIDLDLWAVRGMVNLIAVPLLALSAARNRNWSLNVFVSRDIVLYSTTILGAGLYLLLMAAAGYYLKEYGGSWGGVAQVLFFSLALVLLISVLTSGRLRIRFRIFLAKHFYMNKYDYRREWLKLTRELSDKSRGKNSFEAVIRVLAHIVDARAGQLWLRNEHLRYKNVAAWYMGRSDDIGLAGDSLVRFLEDTAYVINLLEMDLRPDEYRGLKLSGWLDEDQQGWLIVPLFSLESLIGFVVLAKPMVARPINWEDRDLLKIAARQLSNHLTVLMTSEALAQSRQFEVFNRLSAYMVHDLKNIAAGLEMVAINYQTHKANPEFLEDAFSTVTTASGDIKRLLNQLRGKQVESEKQVVIDLAALVQEAVTSKQGGLPCPEIAGTGGQCQVVAEEARLRNVVIHMIDNAQQATIDDGLVALKIFNRASMLIVEIRDNGQGMDADFIENRLFKPFDTTKGNAGMGVGMYESREFIQRLGGNIHVESEAGKGTVVELQIPEYVQQPEPQLTRA